MRALEEGLLTGHAHRCGAQTKETPPFTLWLEFEEWQPEEADDPEDDFFNMTISLPDGRKYALNVWTYRFLEGARHAARETRDNLGGAYILPPDLLVARLDRHILEQVVSDLIHTKQLDSHWLVQPDLDEE